MKRPNRKDYINKKSKVQLIADLERYIDHLEGELQFARLWLPENKPSVPTRVTFDGRKISYNKLSQQHLSNIVWFKRLLVNQPTDYEMTQLHLRYESELLPYRPSAEFTQEINVLKSKGFVKDGKIFYKGKEIGEIVE